MSITMYIVGGILFSIYMFFTFWNIMYNNQAQELERDSSNSSDGLGNKPK